MSNIQPAVKKETINVAISTTIGVVLMWIVFVLLSVLLPEFWALEYTIFPAGICGGLVAVLNFLLMGLTVQKVAACEDEKMAQSLMRASYSRRMLLQVVWVIVAIAAPCFQFIAGILPLIFPSIGIKLVGIYKARKNS
ncbi:MAG: ATP synthase subunit I [Lachnospiraceae bacterium]|nr:ATP synthase subunit I [Lachnospiraceae bacterium]